MINLAASDIAKATGGKVIGKDRYITKVAKLEEADSDSLCFFSNPKYENALYDTKAGMVIVPEGFEPSRETSFTRIEHANPYYAFCMILDQHFNPNFHKSGIESDSYISSSAILGDNLYVGSTAYIDDNAEVGSGSRIYPQVFIGRGAKIGKNTTLYAGAKVYAGCVVGDNCIIHSNAVIGSDGFGFAPVGDVYLKIPQIGNVVIENNVEIGANCAIDRATMGSTIIRSGTKLDNLIQIAHNVEIGKNTVIAAHAAIAGSTKIGDNCQIGGQVGIVGHIHIANKTGIGAQAGVSKGIEQEGTNWIGSPASPIKEQFRSWAAFKKLPDALTEIKDLKKELEALKNELANKK